MKPMIVYLVVLLSSMVLVTGFAAETKKKSSKDKVVIRLANKSEIGMNVECVTHGADLLIEKATKVGEYHTTNFYFCTPGEEVKFEKDPEAYLEASLTNTDQDMEGMTKDKDSEKKEEKKSDMKMEKKSEKKSGKKEMDM